MRGLSNPTPHRRFNRRQDRRKHQIRPRIDLLVAEPHHPKVLPPQPIVPHRVVGFVVQRPVRLDDQPVAHANEVHHVSANRNLPPELQVTQPPVAKDIPEPPLGRTRRAPHRLGKRQPPIIPHPPNMILLPLREKVSAKPTDEGSMGLSASIQRFDFIEV